MEKYRIQDDLYYAVNGEWLEQAVIPADKPTTGGFADLATGVEKLLTNDLKEMIEKDEYPNEYLKRACGLYKIISNVKKRNKDGIKPCLKTLKRIESLKDISSLNRHLKDFILDSLPLPFNLSVENDMKDTNHYLLYMEGPSTILPDTTYYQVPEQKDAILGMYTNMVKQVLAYTKLTDEEKELYISDTLKFDAIIATLVKSHQEWSEYTKSYNITSFRTVSSLVKPLKLRKAVEEIFGIVPEKMSVADPRFLKGFKTLFNEETFELYKHWAYVKELIGSCSLLSEDLRVLGSSYQRALTGVAEAPNLERYAYNMTSRFYSEPIGLYYGEKYFGEEAKKDVIDMVYEIIETYKKRIKENNFLEEATKEKAILKLSKMGVKMGYPDKVRELYDLFVYDENDSLYNIASKFGRIILEDNFSNLNKEQDRTIWAMPGNMVNACYNPFVNDITFPSAILQAPFYSINQTRSQNLGGIGAVIGHEISHAFDNNGAQFDEFGNLSNWWTKQDVKKFNKKTKDMIKEFEGITLPWGEVNSELIVSENIADNGGMSVTLDIMSRMDNKSYEEYFINWAKVWCMKGKPEYLAMLLKVDVHAPTYLRANMQPRNFPEWYDTFKVKKTDKMYIAPNKRVVIW